METLMRDTEAPARAVTDDTLGRRMVRIPGSIATTMYRTILMTNCGAFGKHIRFFHLAKFN